MPKPLGPPPIRVSLADPLLPTVWAEFFLALQQWLAAILTFIFPIGGNPGDVLTSNGPGTDPSFQAGGLANLFPTADVTIPAGFSLVVATTYHLASGVTLHIGANGVLAII